MTDKAPDICPDCGHPWRMHGRLVTGRGYCTGKVEKKGKEHTCRCRNKPPEVKASVQKWM